jgi:formate/nitrite transporter
LEKLFPALALFGNAYLRYNISVTVNTAAKSQRQQILSLQKDRWKSDAESRGCQMEKTINTLVNKAGLPVRSLIIRSIFSGLFIAFGGLGSHIFNTMTGTSYLGAFVFPVGLISVILTGSELFTGNCLMVIPLADNKLGLKRLLKAWVIVYAGNYIGSLTAAFMVRISGLMTMADGRLEALMIGSAVAKTSAPAGILFSKGILCNFLVCLAVYCAMQADSTIGKIFSAYFPVMLFVLCGFEHSIANMYFISLGQLSGEIGITGLFRNLIPVTAGNIIGGVLFALGMYYGYPKEKK